MALDTTRFDDLLEQATRPADCLAAIVDLYEGLQLADASLAWGYRNAATGNPIPAWGEETLAELELVRTRLASLVRDDSRWKHHVAQAALTQPPVMTWQELRHRIHVDTSTVEEWVYSPARIRDYARTFVMDGDELLGFAGVMRTNATPFDARDRAELERAVPLVRRAYTAARRLERRAGERLLIVREVDGVVQYANSEETTEVFPPSSLRRLVRDFRRAQAKGQRRREMWLQGQPVLVEALFGQGPDVALVRLPVPRRPRVGFFDLLSDRQKQVSQHLADGMTAREVGDALNLSPETVRTHTRNAYKVLGISRRAELVTLVKEQQATPRAGPQSA